MPARVEPELCEGFKNFTMPRRSLRLRNLSDDDEFESEVFKELNSKKERETDSKHTVTDSDDDSSDAEEEEELETSDEDRAALSDDDEGDADNDGDSSHYHVRKESDDSDGNEDDDEPESIGFQDSRAAAMNQMEQILADLKREKAKKKALRQEIDQRNRIQKANKEKRLRKAAAEAEEDEDAPPEKQFRMQHSAVETEDYIPLNSRSQRNEVVSKKFGSSTVQVLADSKSLLAKEDVANFRQQMLFGGNVRRVSTQKMLQQRAKRQALRRRR